VALQQAEMRMVTWMYNVKVKDRVLGQELRERLGIDDIILILQQNRLRWAPMVWALLRGVCVCGQKIGSV